MRRFIAGPVLAVALVAACQDTVTEPAAVKPLDDTALELSSPGDGSPALHVSRGSAGVPRHGLSPASVGVTSSGSDFMCTTVVTLGTFDNVVVPPGAVCDISNSMVKGNIKALENSTLFVSGGNTIGGSVQGDKARDVEVFSRPPGLTPNVIHGEGVVTETVLEVFVCGATLTQGNINVLKGRVTVGVGGRTGSACAGFGGGNNVEKGNIKVEDNFDLSFFEVTDNRVAQNLQVYKNSGPGTKRVQFNSAGESVQCFDNAPPFVGGPNFAPKLEGQCF